MDFVLNSLDEAFGYAYSLIKERLQEVPKADTGNVSNGAHSPQLTLVQARWLGWQALIDPDTKSSGMLFDQHLAGRFLSRTRTGVPRVPAMQSL